MTSGKRLSSVARLGAAVFVTAAIVFAVWLGSGALRHPPAPVSGPSAPDATRTRRIVERAPVAAVDAIADDGESSEGPDEDLSRQAFADEVQKWESPREGEISAADAEAFCKVLSRVPFQYREEEIDWALNLIPDENALVLAGVLLDKSQPKEVLDSVFNDLLNRDEGIKGILLQKIWSDRSHPCWEDVNWILEATDSKPSDGIAMKEQEK